MAKNVSFRIDGKDCTAEEGQYLVDAAAANGVYIPTLCNMKGVSPQGSCRVCTVKVNGRAQAAIGIDLLTHNPASAISFGSSNSRSSNPALVRTDKLIQIISNAGGAS